MKIKVESCWSGGTDYSFRLTMPDGKREHIKGFYWTRSTSSKALDMLESVYGYKRRNIRFDIH